MSRPASARLAIVETFWAHSLTAESRSSCLGKKKIHDTHGRIFMPVHGSPPLTCYSDGCQLFLPRLRLFGRQVIQMNFARPHGVDRDTQVNEVDLNYSSQMETQVNELDLHYSAQMQRRVCVCKGMRSRFCVMHGDFRVSAAAHTLNANACAFVPSSSSWVGQ
jgi:hypothetical protein